MSTIAVDPRLRARRVSVAREAGRRRLRRVVLALAVVGAVVAASALTFTPLLAVDAVAVEGGRRTTPAEVAAAAGVRPGDALVWMDAGAVERAVTALPWVADAQVSRSWSGTVTIEVTERTAVAVAGSTDGQWLLLDASGRVLERTAARPDGPVAVDGIVASGRPGEQVGGDLEEALALASAIPAGIRGDVDAVVVDTGAQVALRLHGGGVVTPGDAGEARERLAAAAAVLAAVPVECVARLDVRLAAAPALVRVPECGS